MFFTHLNWLRLNSKSIVEVGWICFGCFFVCLERSFDNWFFDHSSVEVFWNVGRELMGHHWSRMWLVLCMDVLIAGPNCFVKVVDGTSFLHARPEDGVFFLFIVELRDRISESEATSNLLSITAYPRIEITQVVSPEF